jgi:predicted nucleic acid-binding protein
VIVYAESSAVLSWLLGEPRGPRVRYILEAAEFVVTSELTLVECDRALHRARSLGQISEQVFEERSSELQKIAAGWVLLRLSDDIVARAREGFPEEPIRSLDALHLASALATLDLIPETAILTFDGRVQRCGRALGFTLLSPSG